jgi:hypothetical protein
MSCRHMVRLIADPYEDRIPLEKSFANDRSCLPRYFVVVLDDAK